MNVLFKGVLIKFFGRISKLPKALHVSGEGLNKFLKFPVHKLPLTDVVWLRILSSVLLDFLCCTKMSYIHCLYLYSSDLLRKHHSYASSIIFTSAFSPSCCANNRR